MTAKCIWTHIGRLAAIGIGVSGLMASEFHGTVKCGGLPFPGVTVTATEKDQRAVTTTDGQGVFRYPELADGVWTIEVEMLGFEKITRQVGVAPDAPSADWTLKFLSEAALSTSLDSGAAPEPSASPAPRQQPPAGVAPDHGAGAPVRNTAASGFQQLDVSQSTDAAAAGTAGAIKTEEIADLSQSTANSFIVQGSMSSALGMNQQNDWGPPGMGSGGPGMMGAGGLAGH